MNAEPVPIDERSLELDVLRGVALACILVVNAVTVFRVSVFEQLLPAYVLARRSPIDAAVHDVVVIALESKGLALFSLLFGIGIALQHDRLTARGIAPGPVLARRMAVLFVIGLLHLVFLWNGDILTLYAILGAATVPLARLPRAALLVLSLALVGLHFGPIPFPPPFGSPAVASAHVEAARIVYAHGSWRSVLAFRVAELGPIVALLLWTAPRTLGLFLLGVVVARSGVLAGRPRAFVTAMIGAIPVGLALVWSARAGLFRRSTGAAADLGAVVLALGYAAAVLSILRLAAARRLLATLVPLGRTALSCYLLQSLALGWIFYGYGLGLFGRLGEARTAAIAIAIYAVEGVVAAAWLARMRVGPVEWFWRSATYGAWQPLRR